VLLHRRPVFYFGLPTPNLQTRYLKIRRKPGEIECFALTDILNYPYTLPRSDNPIQFLTSRNIRGVPVNKNDLVAAVADSAGLSKADAAKAVDGVLEAITGQLKAGGDVRIVGFGTFAVSKRAASKGRNPQTGAEINIPASNQPKFKAGKGLKDAVN